MVLQHFHDLSENKIQKNHPVLHEDNAAYFRFESSIYNTTNRKVRSAFVLLISHSVGICNQEQSAN